MSTQTSLLVVACVFVALALALSGTTTRMLCVSLASVAVTAFATLTIRRQRRLGGGLFGFKTRRQQRESWEGPIAERVTSFRRVSESDRRTLERGAADICRRLHRSRIIRPPQAMTRKNVYSTEDNRFPPLHRDPRFLIPEQSATTAEEPSDPEQCKRLVLNALRRANQYGKFVTESALPVPSSSSLLLPAAAVRARPITTQEKELSLIHI